jgi:hypothetical protein
MADLPTHFDTGDDPDAGPRPVASRSRRRATAWIFLAVALVAVFVVLHLTGVLGPGGHG